MSDLIETGDAMKQVAVSRHSGAGTLIFSNIAEDDPRMIRGSAPVFITAIITGFHLEYPMVPEESGPGRRPYALVNAQIESINGPIGGMNRNLVFAEYDPQKFTFYYPISNEEMRNMIYDGLFDYKTFADTLAAQMKDEFREVTFSCDMDYTLFMPMSEGEFQKFLEQKEANKAEVMQAAMKQILVCDPVSVFHDRSFLEPSVDFIPPSIQDNEKIYGLSFRLDEASEVVGKICAETDQEEAAVRSVNDVKIRDLNLSDDDLLNSLFSSEQIEALLNESEDDIIDEYENDPYGTLWQDEEEEDKPDLRADEPLFSFDPMAEEASSDDLLEEDEPEENVPDIPEMEEPVHTSAPADTMVFAKGTELSDSVKMTEEMKKDVPEVSEAEATENAQKAQADADIDELFAKFDEEAEKERDASKDTVVVPKQPATPESIKADETMLQQKAEDTGLYTDSDEDEDELFITDK
jgi:hypothetical protein